MKVNWVTVVFRLTIQNVPSKMPGFKKESPGKPKHYRYLINFYALILPLLSSLRLIKKSGF